jgi:hypothetical protein
VIVIDTISKNKLQGRTWAATVKERLVKESVIVRELPKRQLYIGFDAGFDKADFIHSVGTGFLYKTKEDRVFKLSLGVDNRNNMISPFASFGMYWKIRLK